jgi:hypothetical protein
MTGALFLAYVKRILKRTDKDTEVYEATTDTVADNKLQLKNEDFKTESAALTISALYDYAIDLPTSFQHLIGNVTLVDDSSPSDKVLCKISKQTYDSRYGDRLHTTTSDIDVEEPEDFCIFGGQILLGPVPDSASYNYYINYTTEAYTEVTAVTDPVPFTTLYRSIVRFGVLADVYAGLESFDEANYWRQLYVDGLLKIKANEDDTVGDKEPVTYHGV